MYKKYEPKNESNLHSDNRGFNKRPDLYAGRSWLNFGRVLAHNPFKVGNYGKQGEKDNGEGAKSYGSDEVFEKQFNSVKEEIDGQTHESMTRAPMTNADVGKRLPI